MKHPSWFVFNFVLYGVIIVVNLTYFLYLYSIIFNIYIYIHSYTVYSVGRGTFKDRNYMKLTTKVIKS